MGQRWPLCISLNGCVLFTSSQNPRLLAQSLLVPNSNSYMLSCFKYSLYKHIFSHLESIYFVYASKLCLPSDNHRKYKPCGLDPIPQMFFTTLTWKLPALLLSDITQTHLPPLWFSLLWGSPVSCFIPLRSGSSYQTFPHADLPRHWSQILPRITASHGPISSLLSSKIFKLTSQVIYSFQIIQFLDLDSTFRN